MSATTCNNLRKNEPNNPFFGYRKCEINTSKIVFLMFNQNFSPIESCFSTAEHFSYWSGKVVFSYQPRIIFSKLTFGYITLACKKWFCGGVGYLFHRLGRLFTSFLRGHRFAWLKLKLISCSHKILPLKINLEVKPK